MWFRIFALLTITLYLMVIVVGLNEGPLVSFQSLILGIIGLVIIIILASEIAKRINLVDVPDGMRKRHSGSVPLIGGLVLFVSFVYGAFVFGVDAFYIFLIISLIPILIIGTIDGIKGVVVPIPFRIIIQILASWIVILTTDIYIRNLGNLFGAGDIQLAEFGIPFTIFGVVGLCNAFNMLDGKDGLAGSVAVIIFSGLFLILYLNGIIYNWGGILILSLLVYLAFNLSLLGHGRRIFLGEHGSIGLGHVVAWSFVYISQETEIITPVSSLYFVIMPLLDALLTFSRRIMSSKSIFLGDNRHFHHLLFDRGYSDFKILIILSALTTIGVVVGVLSNYLNIDEFILFFIFITIFVCLVLLTRTKKDILDN